MTTRSGLLSLLRFGDSFGTTRAVGGNRGLPSRCKRRFGSSLVITSAQQTNGPLLVVVGGGAAGVYASIRAKEVAPFLNVLVIEKGKLLSKLYATCLKFICEHGTYANLEDADISFQEFHLITHPATLHSLHNQPTKVLNEVKISGGGRCNVTNGHFVDSLGLAENYPRGNKELRGFFFNIHGPQDTMCWLSDHGVQLKTEEDGRVFPVSNNSASVVDCLLNEAKRSKVSLQTGKVVSNVSVIDNGKFLLKVEKRTVDFVEFIDANYVLIATGSSQQGHKIAAQLGHSIIDPMPSLFTFKIEDAQLASLSGVTFPRVKAKLKVENVNNNKPGFTQVGSMLVTHWGLSGPVILRLSAWGARELFLSNYTGVLFVDFLPDIHIEDAKHILLLHKNQFAKQKANNSFPSQFDFVKRFWRFLLERQGFDGDILWASIPKNHLNSIAHLVKQCPFKVVGKGQFKDEFVTAGGVPLSEISLDTMESKIRTNLFFAGEVLNVDGVTGGFNFQNAWTGGYIAGTSIGERASGFHLSSELL